MAGKTVLSQWLAGMWERHKHEDENNRTLGFLRHSCNLNTPIEGIEEVFARIFDCGGHQEQYSTHQLFYTPYRNLFLLCASEMETWEESGVERYLSMIRAFVKRAPKLEGRLTSDARGESQRVEPVGVVIVITHCDRERAEGASRVFKWPGQNDPAVVSDPESKAIIETLTAKLRQDLNEEPNLIIRIVDGVSNWEGLGVDRVKAALSELTAEVPAIARELKAPQPESFWAVRAWVKSQFPDAAPGQESDRDELTPVITKKTFIEKGCVTNKCLLPAVQLRYLETLHELGDVIYVGEEEGAKRENRYLRDQILNPRWFQRWAYQLVRPKRVAEAKGAFLSLDRVNRLIPQDQDRRVLFDLLTHRKIIFPRMDRDESLQGYLVPDLLQTSTQGEREYLMQGDPWTSQTLPFIPFLREGEMARLAIANIDHITVKSQHWYRDAILFTFRDGCQAMVTADFNKHSITVRVRGKSPAAAQRHMDQIIVQLDPPNHELWEQPQPNHQLDDSPAGTVPNPPNRGLSAQSEAAKGANEQTAKPRWKTIRFCNRLFEEWGLIPAIDRSKKQERKRSTERRATRVRSMLEHIYGLHDSELGRLESFISRPVRGDKAMIEIHPKLFIWISKHRDELRRYLDDLDGKATGAAETITTKYPKKDSSTEGEARSTKNIKADSKKIYVVGCDRCGRLLAQCDSADVVDEIHCDYCGQDVSGAIAELIALESHIYKMICEGNDFYFRKPPKMTLCGNCHGRMHNAELTLLKPHLLGPHSRH